MDLLLILRCLPWLLTVLSLGAVTYLKLENSSLKQDLSKLRTISTIAGEQSDANLKVLQTAFPFVVDHAEKRGWTNAKRAFGTCPIAGGVRANGLLPAFGSGEAPAPKIDGGTEPEFVAAPRQFVTACSEDAGYRNLVIEACHRNPLICEFK